MSTSYIESDESKFKGKRSQEIENPYEKVEQSASFHEKMKGKFNEIEEEMSKLKEVKFDFKYHMDIDGNDKDDDLPSKCLGTQRYLNAMLSDRMKDFLYSEDTVNVGKLDGLFKGRLNRELEHFRNLEFEQFYRERCKLMHNSSLIGKPRTARREDAFTSRMDGRRQKMSVAIGNSTTLLSLRGRHSGMDSTGMERSLSLFRADYEEAMAKIAKRKASQDKEEAPRVNKFAFGKKYLAKRKLLDSKFDEESLFQKEMLRLKQYERIPVVEVISNGIPLENQAKIAFNRIKRNVSEKAKKTTAWKGMVGNSTRKSDTKLKTRKLSSIKDKLGRQLSYQPKKMVKYPTITTSKFNFKEEKPDFKAENDKSLAKINKELSQIQELEQLNKCVPKKKKKRTLSVVQIRQVKDMKHFLVQS